MCSGALVMSRVKRVCYAVGDPKMGCLGGAANLNDLPRSNHHFELTQGGVLEDECRDLLQAFFRLKRMEPGENGGVHIRTLPRCAEVDSTTNSRPAASKFKFTGFWISGSVATNWISNPGGR